MCVRIERRGKRGDREIDQVEERRKSKRNRERETRRRETRCRTWIKLDKRRVSIQQEMDKKGENKEQRGK